MDSARPAKPESEFAITVLLHPECFFGSNEDDFDDTFLILWVVTQLL